MEKYVEFFLSLALTLLLNVMVFISYRRNATSYSSDSSMGVSMILLSLVIVLIITTVKSSLQLSLGLVGALSIIRFRSAIKDPQDLSYIFLAMGVGISIAAGYQAIATITVLFILLLAEILASKKMNLGLSKALKEKGRLRVVLVENDSNQLAYIKGISALSLVTQEYYGGKINAVFACDESDQISYDGIMEYLRTNKIEYRYDSAIDS